MRKFISIAIGSLLAASVLFAQSAFAAAPAASDCAAKAVSKDGKPLYGAAKNSSIKKCEADAKAATPALGCADKAIDKNGKPLAGAAKNSFMKKCEADAKAGK